AIAAGEQVAGELGPARRDAEVRPRSHVAVLDRQARLPGLRRPLRVVEELGLLRQRVEVVPLLFEQTDALPRLELELDPLRVVPLEREHLLEIALALPVLQPGTIQQHDAGREIARAVALAVPVTAEDRLPLHVAAEQLRDVAD